MFACLEPLCMWMFTKEVFTIPQHSHLYCPSNQCSLKHFLMCSSDHIFILWKQIKMYERMKVDGDSYCQAPTSKSMHCKSLPYGLCTILLLNWQKKSCNRVSFHLIQLENLHCNCIWCQKDIFVWSALLRSFFMFSSSWQFEALPTFDVWRATIH